jgi:thymidylate synthase (FAD)
MEAFVLVFEVSGVSRACTHQIVRSRRAGFHQQSQRATSYTTPEGVGPDIRVPESVWRAIGGGDPGSVGAGLGGDDDSSELAFAWDQALMWSRRAYRLALEADVSYQDARYILPEGTQNYIMCEYTLREFLAVYDYRACSMFNWEIVNVVRTMGDLLKRQSPWIIGTGAEPRISCERTRQAIDIAEMRANGEGDGELGIGVGKPLAMAHACTFQGWEQVEPQCGFDWARESNRTFKPSRSI